MASILVFTDHLQIRIIIRAKQKVRLGWLWGGTGFSGNAGVWNRSWTKNGATQKKYPPYEHGYKVQDLFV